MPIVVGLVTFVVVLVGAVLVLADWVERNLEMRALVTNIEMSEAAMADVQEAIADMAVHFDPNTPLTEEEQAAVDDELKGIASQGADGVGRAGGLVAAVPVLPWHADILAAQEAYLAHNQAWQDYLTAAAADPTEFAKPQDAVNETFAAAEQPMRTAVPPLTLFELKRRVDVILRRPPSRATARPRRPSPTLRLAREFARETRANLKVDGGFAAASPAVSPWLRTSTACSATRSSCRCRRPVRGPASIG